jgi:hypothetical protein
MKRKRFTEKQIIGILRLHAREEILLRGTFTERSGKILDRVTRVEVVLYAIAALLLIGEGSLVDLLRRLIV